MNKDNPNTQAGTQASQKTGGFDLLPNKSLNTRFSTIFGRTLALVLAAMALALLLVPLPETPPRLPAVAEPNESNSTSSTNSTVNHPATEPSAALPPLKID